MKLRKSAFLAVLILAAASTASGTPTSRPAPAPAVPQPTVATTVIDLNGLGDARIGATEQDLTRRGLLRPEEETCGPGLAGNETVSPIFYDNRLVLLWASPPVHTPEGVTVGTPVSRVRAAYPRAVRLTAPRGTYRFDGLLARRGDRAYLFLHDGRRVTNTIAGYADYAEKLFDEGYSPC